MRGLAAVPVSALAALVTVGLSCTPREEPEPARPEHVIVVSIDGLMPRYYLEAEGFGIVLPSLSSMMIRGVYAESVLGVMPTTTYPAHATLVTGVPPAVHGITTNLGHDRWRSDASDIRVPTLWSVAEGAGLVTAVVTWPSSYGAEVDYLVPEVLAFGPDADPAARIREGSTPGLFEGYEAEHGVVELPPFEDPEAGLLMDRMTTDLACRIIGEHRPDLLLVHLLDLDHRLHATGVDTPEVFASIERMDGMVTEIRNATLAAGIHDQTAVFVVGDHGFATIHTEINLAALLVRAGLRPAVGEAHALALSFWSSGGSAAVFADESLNAVAADMVLGRFRRTVEAELGDVVTWMTREELDNLGGFPAAAAALAAVPGYVFRDDTEHLDRLLNHQVHLRGNHGYPPTQGVMDTGFLAAGCGIAAGGSLGAIDMLDIAPTVAEALGLELPSAHGAPMRQVFATGVPSDDESDAGFAP